MIVSSPSSRSASTAWHAAVVELDALADAVRAAAEDDDLLRRSVGARLVTRPRRSSRGTACSASNSAAQVSTRLKTGRMPRLSAGLRAPAPRWCRHSFMSRRSEKPSCFALQQRRAVVQQRDAALRAVDADRLVRVDHLPQVAQEPGVDLGELVNASASLRPARIASASCHRRSGLGAHDLRASSSSQRRRRCRQVQAPAADLQRAQRLAQALLEGAADRHHLADRLHLRGRASASASGNFSNAKRGILITT